MRCGARSAKRRNGIQQTETDLGEQPGTFGQQNNERKQTMSDAIKCPKCTTATMATVTFQGVEVDRCPQCSGIWFDMLEQEELRKKKGSDAVDVGAGKAKTTSQGQKLDCPKCHTRMSPTHDARQPHIVFEK